MYQSKALSLKRVSAGLIAGIFAFTLLLTGIASTNASTASLTNLAVSPSTFNPDTQTTTLSFDVTQNGQVAAEVYQGTNLVKVLAVRQVVTPGHQSYVWNGTNQSGTKVNEGDYKIRLVYYGDGFTVFEVEDIRVEYNVTPPAEVDVITNDYVTPTTFDPRTQTTKVYFTLNEQVNNLSLGVYKNGALVKKLLSGVQRAPGVYYVTWNGQNSSNVNVAAGLYQYQINAVGVNNTDTASGNVTVSYDQDPPTGTAPNVTNDYADPAVFDPTTDYSNIKFTLNTSATTTVEIYTGNNLVKTLLSSNLLSARSYTYRWDGRKTNGAYVPEGSYTYKVTSENAYGSDVETGPVTVSYEDVVNETDPQISNAYADPQVFTPQDGERMNVYYTLNTCAYVQIKVYSAIDNDLVRVVQDYEYQCAGQQNTYWDGYKDNNAVAQVGDYVVSILAVNSVGSDQELEYVEVEDDDLPTNGPDVSNLALSRTTFDPDDNETTTLSYNLDECADVTVRVYDDDDDLVDELYDDYTCNSTKFVTWDGEDDDNDQVYDGRYYFEVRASNDDGSDREVKNVYVDTDGSGSGSDDEPEITRVDVTEDPFDPYNERTEIEFRLNTCADVTVEVRDDDNDVVRVLVDDRELCSGYHDYSWDGEDEDDDVVYDGDYEFYIRAYNSEGSDTARESVEVDRYSNGGGSSADRCHNYLDVNENDPYCDAIEYVSSKGIFDGYPDGMFRPYQSINRAETSKVIIKGFNYPILSADGTNLGFWDVSPESWFVSYLRTGKSYGILQGYPDGSFQPARTVNRVELLKIFLESANVATPHCTVAPYLDTPIKADTEWYMPYVCYAKQHNLVDVDNYGYFNPNEPMSRGDVAELFYRFANRGLDTSYNDTYYYDSYNYDNYYDPFVTWVDDDEPRLTDISLSDDRVGSGDTMRIYFTLNVRSDVTVEVIDDDNDVVRELSDDIRMAEGRHSIYFSGEDDNGNDLRVGDYEVRIVARNSDGSDREDLGFDVVDDDSDGDLIDISDLETDPEDEFDPDHEDLEIRFDLTRTADVTIRIYDEDDDLVRELWDDRSARGGTHLVRWDGEDDDGDDLRDGDYIIEIRAESSLGNDKEEIRVEINT